MISDIETVTQVGKVAITSFADCLVGDVLHASHLLRACCKGVLEHLAQIARAAVRRVIRRRPEGDRFDCARAYCEVLLHEELVLARIDLELMSVYGHLRQSRLSYLVPAGLSHTVDILLVRGTTAVDNAVAITATVANTSAPFVGDIKVAGGVARPVSTSIRCDVGLSLSHAREASENRSRQGKVGARHGES